MEKGFADTTQLFELVTNQLEHLRFEENDTEVRVTLVDVAGDEIVRGFGKDILEAINDLHYSLL